MASSTTKSPVHIKTEPIDIEVASTGSYQRYGTPMTSSPTGVDSTTKDDAKYDQLRDNENIGPAVTPFLLHALTTVEQNFKSDFTKSSTHVKTFGCKRRRSGDLLDHYPLKSGRTNVHQQPYEHYEGQHSTDLIKSMHEMRLTNKLIDLVLVVHGREIKCHTVVVGAVSSYFMNLFNSEKNQHRINITRTSFDVMHQLVEFCYTSRVNITDENIQELLSASNHFKFNGVRQACLFYLKRKINTTNCLAIEKFALSEPSCTKLATDALQFARENFYEVSKTTEFVELPLSKLLSFISNDVINVKYEEVIYSAAMKWIRHDVQSRKTLLRQVLEKVRLPLLKPQFLLDIVQNDDLIKEDKSCEPLLDEARRFHLLVDQRPLMQSTRTVPRVGYSIKKSEVLVAVGGLNKDKQFVSDCFYYTFPEASSQRIAPLTVPQTAYSVTTVNNNIFVTGGACTTACNDVWMYIPSLDVWIQVAPLLHARYLHASVGVDGKLFVVGGHNGTKRLKSIERYNPDTNTWHLMTPMTDAVSSPTAVTCDGRLYVVGGATGSHPNDIICKVQCYDVTTDTWSCITPLPQAERGAVAANLNGVIYVLGQQKRVYAYNRKAEKWLKMSDTNAGHLHGAAAVHKGRLYVAGGLHGNSYINGTIEVYDQLSDNWSVVGTLHTPVYAQGFVNIVKHIKL